MATYANSIGHGFAMDDRWVIVRNPLIQSLAHVPRLLLSNYYAPNFEVALYRPVATVSYALNHAWSGLEPWSYHAVNVVLHGANAALVFVLAGLVGLGRPAALLAGALFATHAVHAEAVANVAGRPELFAAFFFVAALVGHALLMRSERRSPSLYVATLAAYLLALLSKENAITWIGVVWLHDLVRVATAGSLRERLRALLARGVVPIYAGYALVTLVYLAMRYVALGDGPAAPPVPRIDNPLVLLSFPWNFVTALSVAWRYVGLLLLPLHLTYDYSYAQIPLLRSFADPRVWWVLALSAGALAGLFVLARRAPRACFAVGFAIVTFSVVSNWIVPIGTIMAERLLYLPSVGFCLALALAFERLAAEAASRWGRTPVRAVAVVAGLVVVAHAARAFDRSADWRSKEHLYVHDVQVSSRSAKALNNAGWILIDRELDVARGVALLERALEIWPDEAEYLDSLGWGHYKLGNLEKARLLLQRSLELRPSGPGSEDRREHLRIIEEALRERPHGAVGAER